MSLFGAKPKARFFLMGGNTKVHWREPMHLSPRLPARPPYPLGIIGGPAGRWGGRYERSSTSLSISGSRVPDSGDFIISPSDQLAPENSSDAAFAAQRDDGYGCAEPVMQAKSRRLIDCMTCPPGGSSRTLRQGSRIALRCRRSVHSLRCLVNNAAMSLPRCARG